MGAWEAREGEDGDMGGGVGHMGAWGEHVGMWRCGGQAWWGRV